MKITFGNYLYFRYDFYKKKSNILQKPEKIILCRKLLSFKYGDHPNQVETRIQSHYSWYKQDS